MKTKKKKSAKQLRAEATARSQERYARAAAILPKITLNQEQADALELLRNDHEFRGMTTSDLIRTLITNRIVRCY
jgi:hypothetical protein